ncbi:bifunctional metallophosphatase/5'-nucleotidase [Pseudoduganella ginsengisoli]|uniref:Bifunctional metallophosphatase/5'-nucleotidase n=1 Tax=Pseudoduganella ginsengisoli TaxID=1462440 RepID=A0A6L6PWE0_9BURK|nr:bifunctional metallophosphatase/5'-nucleotidase [Pseudoduganella ginsengisoli]MTW01837.1 bifunctional metallophosphatase/5'-nucleotidase [Pseudoduganella ginsengisoli]
MKPIFRTALPALLLASALAGCAHRHPAADPAIATIQLAALNDFHGNLEASSVTYTDVGGVERTVTAGGIATIAGALNAWRKDDPELLLVGAGDLIGASPALSLMWADEPTLAAMNRLGLRVSSVGNHEFDGGRAELLRQQKGGCTSPRPEKACRFDGAWQGAAFQYLAANVFDMVTNKPFLPAYHVETVRGVKVAFIGAVLKDAASSVLASGVAGLQFADEAQSINRVLPELRAQGVNAFVVLIHEGGRTPSPQQKQDCTDLYGPLVDVVKKLDPAIRVVISGHSHKGYLCRVDGRLVTQAEMGGHMLSRVTIDVDRATGRVVGERAANVVLAQGSFPPDAAMDGFLQTVRARSEQALARPVARLAVDTLVRPDDDTIDESALGDLIADSMLYGARAYGAQIAFMNRGGIRTTLKTGAGNVATLGQLQAVLPFGNTIEVVNMTGAQIYAVLEEQFLAGRGVTRGLLQVSDGFTYQWNPSRPEGMRVVDKSVLLHGVQIEKGNTYRVAINHFLLEGGDSFPTFKQVTNVAPTNMRDVDALAEYLISRDRAGKPAGAASDAGRIRRAK